MEEWRRAFTPDGKTILAGTHDGCLRFVDPATGALRESVQVRDSPVTHAALSPDGKKAATASYDGMARLWSVKD